MFVCFVVVVVLGGCFLFFCFGPIYIPWALNMGTCIQQCDIFYSAGLHRNEKIGRGFGENAGEWTGRVEIKKEIPGSKRSMYGYILTYSRLERENV